MKSDGIYDLIILFLSIIIFYNIITDINDDENRIRVIIEDRSVYKDLFYEIFDIHENLLLYILPLEFDIFLDESR
jgi:hypothetical protein